MDVSKLWNIVWHSDRKLEQRAHCYIFIILKKKWDSKSARNSFSELKFSYKSKARTLCKSFSRRQLMQPF